jgi:hypothetical protein
MRGAPGRRLCPRDCNEPCKCGMFSVYVYIHIHMHMYMYVYVCIWSLYDMEAVGDKCTHIYADTHTYTFWQEESLEYHLKQIKTLADAKVSV